MAHIATMTVTRGEPRVEFVYGYGQLNRHSDIDTFLMPATMYLDTQRNILLEQTLQNSDAEWLVWIDDDHGFTVDQVRAICATDHPIVTGVYRTVLGTPALYDVVEDDWLPIPWSRLQNRNGDPLDTPIPVDSCGAGFLATRRDVMVEMGERYGPPNPWFDEPIYKDKKVGEDFGFCLRLAEMGVPIMALPNVIVEHYKVCRLQ